MTDHAARLARILETHPDVVHVGGATEALIKRDELLVLGVHADAVHEQARRWIDSREDFTDLGVARLRLRGGAGVDAAELTHELRGGAAAHRQTSVTPNHVMRATPDFGGGPFGAPEPTGDLVAPVGGEEGGRRVTVGVLDTGIDSHPWFTGSAWYRACTVEEHEALDPAPAELEPESGHGTFIAGVILQHAPSTYLRVERVLGVDGLADELELLRALARIQTRTAADADRLDIVNLSLGCFTFDDRPSPVLADAVARLARQTVVVAAAGNNDSDRPFWPAALKDVVAVAALAEQTAGKDPLRASFSNYGWWVDAAAPGERIASSFLTHRRENGEEFHGYAKWSGTSFAAPYVAGKIAALMSAKDMTAHDAVSELLDPAGTRIPDLGVVVSSVGR
jgi:subtilisin family serine protease